MRIRRIWRKLVGWGVTKKTLKWGVVFFVLKWVATFTLVAYLIRIEKWRPFYWLLFPVLAVGLFLVFGKRRSHAK
ncbi:MAG: hypothetical protein JJ975_13745 [Bacteroidia bacterium]|nr:hypothetical protein [Bacteroidia bacterium]